MPLPNAEFALYVAPLTGLSLTALPNLATTKTELPEPLVQPMVIELSAIDEEVNADACVVGGVHAIGKVTSKEIVVPAVVTFEIFKPPADPFCKKLLGFVASFMAVRDTVDEK